LRGKDKAVTSNFDALKKFAEFRNIDAHSNHMAPYFAQPHEDIVSLIEKIADEIDPKIKAFACAIKLDQIFGAQLTDNAKAIIKHMIAEVFTHVPILDENGILTGVFSESSVFNYFGSHNEIILDDTIAISEFEDFVHIGGRPNEMFSFVSRQELLVSVKEQFVTERQKRLGAIFITENGSPAEKLLGLLTPWDVLPH
jgi:CBS domain-containing protein